MKRFAIALAISVFIAISLNPPIIMADSMFSVEPESNAALIALPPAGASEVREALEAVKKTGASDENMLRLEKALEGWPADLDAATLSDIAEAYVKRGDCGNALPFYEKLLTKWADAPPVKGKTKALYDAAYCGYQKGGVTLAKARLDAITGDTSATAAEKAKAIALSNEIDSILNAAKGTEPKFVVGALLPLNGQYARFGEAALKGMLLAAKVFDKGEGDSIELAIKDTSNEGAPIPDLVDELLEKEEITGIIGPLMSAEAAEASAVIQTRGIAAIMLSQKEGITQGNDYAFRNFLTPKAQAERLAEYAAKTLGLKTAAILAPDNAYGKELASWFARAFTERGRLVSGEMSYEPGKKDFAKELVSFFGIKSEEKKEGRRRIVHYTPTIAPEALFIPDSYNAVAQIAPYLAFYGIKDIQLLGAGGWNSPKLIELGGEYVEGAIFVDGFFVGSKRKETSEFVKLFKISYNYEPGIIEAYAYDSTTALIAATETSGDNRKAVRDSLAAMPGFEGATGKISFDSNREAGQELFILKVKKGSIVEVEADKQEIPAQAPKEPSN